MSAIRTVALLALAGALLVGCYPSITVSPDSLPDATVGRPYSQAITASGGDGVQNISTSGALPPGLTFVYDRSAGTGLLAGTPTTAGTYPFDVSADGPHFNFGGSHGARHYTLVVH
jgi:hypothetical protein